MNLFDGMWIALFFLASAVVSTFIGRSDKKGRERKTEYFKSISGFTKEESQR